MTDAPPLVLAAALLDALEPLPHPGRMSELAAGAGLLAAQGRCAPSSTNWRTATRTSAGSR